MNFQLRTEVLRRAKAVASWMATTRRTTYFVRGSWPISFVTSGWSLRMALRRDLCGSSVCIHSQSFGSWDGTLLGPFWVQPDSFAGLVDPSSSEGAVVEEAEEEDEGGTDSSSDADADADSKGGAGLKDSAPASRA